MDWFEIEMGQIHATERRRTGLARTDAESTLRATERIKRSAKLRQSRSIGVLAFGELYGADRDNVDAFAEN